MPRFLPLFVVVASLTSTHAFQVTKTETVSATGTIQAIDRTSRAVLLKDDKTGTEDSIVVGPGMKRFDELKVGDKVKVRYTESLVLQLRKPGDKSTAAGDSTKLTPSTGAPGGTLARQINTTVTVNAVDLKTPSITYTTADGRTVTRKVENVKNLDGVKAGDRIDVTFTQAAAVELEPAK
jgi:hypothetical protein